MKIFFFLFISLHMSVGAGCSDAKSKEDQLIFKFSKDEIRVGETAKMQVFFKNEQGDLIDVTHPSSGIEYRTQSQIMRKELPPFIKISDSGEVKALNTESGRKTSTAIIYGVYKKLYAGIGTISIIQKDALYVVAEKTKLRVGESVQLKVLRIEADGGKTNITSKDSGTTYYSIYNSVAIVNPEGKVTAISSSEKKRKTVLIGVRNKKDRGNIKFEVFSD